MRLDDPVGGAFVHAVKTGDLAAVSQLLAANPALATVTFEGPRGGRRTCLMLVTDWPGYYPAAGQVAQLLIDAGADLDPPGTEGPLHWAASTDDVDVARVLIAAGADLDRAGGSIGTPLANAVGYGCWHVARMLVEAGAPVRMLWQASALGLDLGGRLETATVDEVSHAFWQACHGGQRRAAELLLARGADPAFVPDYASETAVEIAGRVGTRRSLLVTWLESLG